MKSHTKNAHQKELACYNTYLKLRKSNCSNLDIAEQLGFTLDQLSALISQYAFKGDLEYLIFEEQGDYFFKGELCFSPLAGSVLSNKDIEEIITFIRDLVEQHSGIHYEQKIYHVESDCQLSIIDTSFKCLRNEKPKLLIIVSGEQY